MRKSQVIFFGCLILLLGACGGAGGAKVELVPVATELRPTPDGYAFANFPASASPEEFNADDLAKMFGPEACVGGVVAPCDPIAEAAAWARMVNQARASGACEGMVVEASKRFDLSLSPPTVDLANEGEVTHEIIRTFATQFLPEVQEETLGWGKKSLAAIVAELVESFKSGKAKYSMGLYVERGGHALLPYAVEFPTPDLAVIQLYDSNWPGKNRYVEVDLKAKQWRFSFSGEDPANDPAAWTGGQGFMDLTALDTRGNSTCPFCASKTKVKNSMIVISSVDTDWSISNANGTYSPGTNNSVEGIVSRPIRGSVSPNSVKALEYVVFVEGNDMKLDLPNTTSAFISQGTAVVQVSTTGKNSGTVTITKDTVSVDDPNVNVKVASADLVADVAGNNTVIAITDKQLDVSVESSTGQTFTVAVNQETPQVSAKAVDLVGSSAPTNFVITTQTSDNQVKVREVARDGSETVVTKQASAQTDLNSTKIELAPVLQVSTVKPGLPPLEDRDLKNPAYKADESFVPQTGLVVSKLAEVVVLPSPTTVAVKNATVPEVMNSFGPTTLVPVSTTTVPPTTVPPSSTTTTPTTLPTTTTVKSTTTTVKPVVKITTTTTTTVPPTTTTSSTTTTTSSTTTTTSSTTTSTSTTTVAPPPPSTTTTTSSTTATTIAATAPSAPTSVTGTSGNAQVSLSWTAPSSNGGAAITDYVVQYSTSASSGFATFSDGTSTTTTATVTGLTNNTVYYFKVAAVNLAGTSSYSDVSSGVRPASVPPVISSVTVGNGSLTFAWNAITHGGDNYRVYYGTDSTFNSAYSYTGTTATSYAVTGLTNGTTYYFRVAGWNNSVSPQIATTAWSTNASGTPAVASCANGGVCAVGDTGAGGGVVFYVQASGGTFTSTGSACNTAGVGGISACKYLEAAPTGWIVASTPAGQTNCSTPGTSTVDPICAWSGNTSTEIGATARGTAIGSGYANTSAIIAQTNGGSTAGNAATVSRAYQGGSKTDWFLPSRLELNQLCRYAWNLTVDNTATTCTGRTGTIRTGFSTDNWWSSTESDAGGAWHQYFGTEEYQGTSWKYDVRPAVRPVRAG